MRFFFNLHLTFFLHDGTKSLSPNGMTTHSVNVNSTPDKGSYYRTDETSLLTSKAEVTQCWRDIHYSLEKIAHICAPHQLKGKAAIRKAAQFGVDVRKDHKLLKAKTWPGNSLRGSRVSINSQAYERCLCAGFQAHSSLVHISSARVPIQHPRPVSMKH